MAVRVSETLRVCPDAEARNAPGLSAVLAEDAHPLEFLALRRDCPFWLSRLIGGFWDG